MSSLTIGGTAYRCQPWPKPIIRPAITWGQNTAGYWYGFDRGTAQDIYEAEITFTDTDAVINSLKGVLNSNRGAISLTSLQTPIFAPNVDQTGTISCSAVDFGQREHVQWAGTGSNIQTLTVRFRAISPTLLAPTASLATLRIQERYQGDHSWPINKHFAYNQTGSYIDHGSDVGTLKASFQQTLTESRAILRYILNTARADSFTLPTFSGLTYPFGVSRGAGPFSCMVKSVQVYRKDLNRWILNLEFVEA